MKKVLLAGVLIFGIYHFTKKTETTPVKTLLGYDDKGNAIPLTYAQTVNYLEDYKDLDAWLTENGFVDGENNFNRIEWASAHWVLYGSKESRIIRN